MKDDFPAFALSDKPLGEDLLGYAPYVRAMAKLLSSSSLETPFCVGIYGPWGTGKSTFMVLLEDYLLKEADTVWFEPWLFNDKEEVWKSLVLTVLQLLERKASERGKSEQQVERLRNLMCGLGKVALSRAISSLVGISVDLDEITSLYSNTAYDSTKFVNTFRATLKDVKDEILDTNTNPHKRLIVFVDDLDRCSPENCVMVLEAIKLFFDLDGCVFVIGIDNELVQKGVELKYHENLNFSGKEYLDKLIQLPFTLPSISEPSFRQFVNLVTQPFKFDDLSVNLVGEASEQNPRRVKRLSNCLHLIRSAASEIANTAHSHEFKEGFSESKLALLLMLQVRFPMAYRWMNQHPFLFNELDETEKNKTMQQLEGDLTRIYGQEVAERTAKGFFHLMKVAFSNLQVPQFKSHQELLAYLRITGLVQTPMGAEGRSLKDLLDRGHNMDSLITEGDKEEPMAPKGRSEDKLRAEFNAIDEEAKRLIERWKARQTTSFLIIGIKKVSNLLDEGQEDALLADDMNQQLNNLGRRVPPDLALRIRLTSAELKKINLMKRLKAVNSTGIGYILIGLASFLLFAYIKAKFSLSALGFSLLPASLGGREDKFLRMAAIVGGTIVLRGFFIKYILFKWGRLKFGKRRIQRPESRAV